MTSSIEQSEVEEIAPEPYRRLQELELEEFVSESLQEEVFGKIRFDKLVDRMIILAGDEAQINILSAIIKDEENKRKIIFSRDISNNERRITIYNFDGDYQGIVYKLDHNTSEIKPYLFSNDKPDVPVSSDTPRDLCIASFSTYLALRNPSQLQSQNNVG